jgi:predicted permease
MHARLDSLVQDVRFGLRGLRKHPAVTAAAIISLALAIGANTAAFSLLDALILRPLPVDHPEQLVYLGNLEGGQIGQLRERTSFSYPLFQRLRATGAAETKLFAMSSQPLRVAVFDTDEEKLHAQFVSGDTFPLLGIRPALGRLLTDADDQHPGAHPVAVISHDFWRRRFNASPSILGRRFTMADHSYEVIGVAQEGFTGIEPGIVTDVWVPMMMGDPRALTGAYWNWFRILGRLQPGVTAEQARLPLQVAFTAFRQDSVKGGLFRTDELPARIKQFVETPLYVRSAANGPSTLRQDFERPLWILATLVALVLLIACANVANLLIARAVVRQREMALRISIGAGRARLVQQVLVESSLLAIAACVLGVLFAVWSAPLIVRLLASSTDPVRLALQVDWRLVGFLALLCAGTTIGFGAVPAIRASAVAPQEVMRRGGGGDGTQTGKRGLGRWLVAAQVAFCFVVLFLAGMFLLTFRHLTMERLGFEQGNLVLVSVSAKELTQTADKGRAAWLLLQDQLRQLPGIEAVSCSAWSLFAGGGWSGGIRVEGRPVDPHESYLLAVSPRFFETMKIQLIDGREFDAYDGASTAAAAPAPAIVNEAFARRYFPDLMRHRDRADLFVGQRFSILGGRDKLMPQEIIGVVQDARYYSVRDEIPPTAYVPLALSDGLASATLELRTSLEPAIIADMVQREMRQVHPAFRVQDVTTQATRVMDTLLRERLLAFLSGFFAIVSMLLAAVGLYGILSFLVVSRTKEIGIRIALGAQQRTVVRLVMFDVLLLIGVGLGVGVIAGFALSRSLTSLLYHVQPSDAVSLAAPLVCLLLATAVAALPPALRAARVDPLVALRHD